MGVRLAWALMAMLAGGCLSLTGEERELASQIRWAVRGRELASYARLYCFDGSLRERRWMREAMDYHALPAVVQIVCPEG